VTETIVPLRIRGHTVYLSADLLHPTAGGDHEVEIAGYRQTADEVLEGVASFAQEMVDKLRDVDVSKVTVQFGCEFGVESGSLVAVIGKASARSAVTIGLEWSSSTLLGWCRFG